MIKVVSLHGTTLLIQAREIPGEQRAGVTMSMLFQSGFTAMTHLGIDQRNGINIIPFFLQLQDWIIRRHTLNFMSISCQHPI